MKKKKLVDDDTAIDNISSLSTYVDDEDIQNWAIKILDERNKLLNELEMLKVGKPKNFCRLCEIQLTDNENLAKETRRKHKRKLSGNQ